jgi:PAS domain S-box-containing protein
MDLTVPEYRPALEDYRERRLNGEITTYESQLLRADGSMVPALVSSSPREINGKYAGSIVVFTDLTEVKQAEKLRRESEERFSTIFHSSPQSIIISRLDDGCIVDVNEAFCSLLEMEREQIIGKSGRELNFWFDNADRDRVIAAIRANGMANALDIQIRPASGRIESAIISGVIIHIAGVEHMLLMGIDITPRKQAEAKLLAAHAVLEQRVIERTAELQAANTALEKASRAKDEFLATMSHELRTPLTGILGLSQSLQFSTYGPLNEKQMTALKNIEKSGWHLQELINEILDITKLQAGKLDLQMRACSLGSICTSSLQMVDDQARKKKLEVLFSISPENITLQADERRLRQIVINLLSNAVKFTPEGGSIELAVSTLPEIRQARISVKDSGIGIKEEDLPHLFQPFLQLDARLAREYNGTGLGLVLVKRLAELHGGSVEVESVFGQGSTFTVSLPWQPEL